MKTNNEPIYSMSIPIVSTLSRVLQVKGILCFGSYATSKFDTYSDIDLYVFCSPDIIPSAVRRETLEKIEGIGDLQIDCEQFGWDKQWNPREDHFLLNEKQFDITYNTLDWIRTVVNKVKDTGATSIPEINFRPYTMLGLLDNSVIIYDPEAILRDLKSSLYPYPSKLKQALLSHNLPIIKDSLEELKTYAERKIGNTAFHFHLQKILDSLGTILFAINERYDPATKRVEEAYSELKILPQNFLYRYKTILETSLTPEGRAAIVRELQAIIDEIYKLTGKQADPPFE